jgi:hypothetical protein
VRNVRSVVVNPTRASAMPVPATRTSAAIKPGNHKRMEAPFPIWTILAHGTPKVSSVCRHPASTAQTIARRPIAVAVETTQLASFEMKFCLLAAIHFSTSAFFPALICRSDQGLLGLSAVPALISLITFSTEVLAGNSVAIAIKPRKTTFGKVIGRLSTVHHFLAVTLGPATCRRSGLHCEPHEN